MRIFILEDDERRIKIFTNKLKDHTLELATSVDQAKSILLKNKETPFDVLFLDHDLDGMVFVNSEWDNTGYQLVKYIVENKILYGYAVIHSQNPDGAKAMHDLLPHSLEIPFIVLELFLFKDDVNNKLAAFNILSKMNK